LKDMPKGANILQDKENPVHQLSLYMMQEYMKEYWVYIDPGLPILHRPTFDANTCPTLLLMGILALGASAVETRLKCDSACSTFLASHLSLELASHLSLEIEFTWLWLVQARLLLEFLETMNSTRSSQDQAHICHPTTIMLIRRSNILNDRSTAESGVPAAWSDPSVGYLWGQWINNETARRAALGGIVLETYRATVLNYRPNIDVHEMKLLLPCDEALWYASNGAEVRRVDQCLRGNGIRPIMFHEALQRVTDSRNIQPNSFNIQPNLFNRDILIAGVIFLSWRQQQQCLLRIDQFWTEGGILISGSMDI
jgi:hypothetical protein